MVFGLNTNVMESENVQNGFLKANSYDPLNIDNSIIFATYSDDLLVKKGGGFIVVSGVGNVFLKKRTGGSLSNTITLNLRLETPDKQDGYISLLSFNYDDWTEGEQMFSFKITVGAGKYAAPTVEWANPIAEAYFGNGKIFFIGNQATSPFSQESWQRNKIVNFSFSYAFGNYVENQQNSFVKIYKVIAEYKEIGS